MEEHLTAKIKWIVATMVASVVMVCAGIFFYISSNTVRDHELRESGTFVRQVNHEKDIARIEDRITSLERVMSQTMGNIGEKLDRNLTEIQKMKGNK